MSVEELESKVKSLIEEIKTREEEMIGEDGECSMLCELNILNLINFLKHFHMEGNFPNHSSIVDNEVGNENKDIIERCYLLENTLKQKVLFIS